MEKEVFVPNIKDLSTRLWRYPAILSGYLLKVDSKAEIEAFLTTLLTDPEHKDKPEYQAEIKEQVAHIYFKVLEHYEKKDLVPPYIGLNVLDDMIMVNFVLEPSFKEVKGGYLIVEPQWFSYVYNLTVDYFSEYGYLYVDWDSKAKFFKRVG